MLRKGPRSSETLRQRRSCERVEWEGDQRPGAGDKVHTRSKKNRTYMASKLPTLSPKLALTSLLTASNNPLNGLQYTNTCRIALAKHKLPLLTNPRGLTIPLVARADKSTAANVAANDLRAEGEGFGTCSLMAGAG